MLKKININSLQIQLFFVAILIYATFGQPTPEKLGVVEGIIACLLVLSIGLFNFLGCITLRPLFEKNRDDTEKIGSVALSFLFIVPTMIGLLSGHNFNLIIRDLVPLVYSFIPLFLYHRLSKKDTANLYYICVYAGVIIALRFLIISDFSWEMLGKTGFYDYDMYLAISPFILFATLFLFLDFFEVKNLIKKVLFMFYSVICAGSMLATSQRASVGAGLFFACLYLVNKAKKNIAYILLGALAFFIIFICFDDYIITAFNMLVEKTKAVGTNSRIAEFRAVINETKDGVFSSLFGKGWGYRFYSPAIMDVKVNFTHCMFSYFLLKTGFVGTVIYTGYLISIFITVFYKNNNLNFISYACLPPILIAMTLYTGYKYFDFGCLLLVLLLTRHIPLSISMKRQEIIDKFKIAGLDNSVLDSSIIIRRVLSLSKTMLFIEGDRVLKHRENAQINKLVRRRLKNEPIARIEKSKEFWGLEFALNKDTLVPRPDSESVIESILENYNKEDKLKVLDLGTGSGCLLLSALSEFKKAEGVGVDLSDNALKQARENAKILELKNRCKFIKSNWFSALSSPLAGEGQSKGVKRPQRCGEGVNKFDIIIANPPYVMKDEPLSKEVLNFDPSLALFAENNGLKCYEEIAKDIKKHLKENGKVFFEIGVGQKAKVSCIMKQAGLVYHSQKKDLKGKIRCLIFVKK